MLEALRAEVLEANLELVRRGLVIYTFGNASGISRPDGLVVIKPSGVPYEKMTAADMVIADLEGRVVEGAPGPRRHIGAQSPGKLVEGLAEGDRQRTRGERIERAGMARLLCIEEALDRRHGRRRGLADALVEAEPAGNGATLLPAICHPSIPLRRVRGRA